jgi:hypothetical protein
MHVMTTLKPKQPKDLSLAPVAAAIDENLRRLRGKAPEEISLQLLFEFDKPFDETSGEERRAQILRQSLRDVDLHRWSAAITEDGSSVRLSGGSVSLDIALSAAVTRYVVDGA